MIYKIKPLEWKNINTGYCANSYKDYYEVYQCNISLKWVWWGVDIGRSDQFDTVEEAKQAAESYYHDRLLEVLEVAALDQQLAQFGEHLEKKKDFEGLAILRDLVSVMNTDMTLEMARRYISKESE